jgi:hypothetical protein
MMLEPLMGMVEQQQLAPKVLLLWLLWQLLRWVVVWGQGWGLRLFLLWAAGLLAATLSLCVAARKKSAAGGDAWEASCRPQPAPPRKLACHVERQRLPA